MGGSPKLFILIIDFPLETIQLLGFPIETDGLGLATCSNQQIGPVATSAPLAKHPNPSHWHGQVVLVLGGQH